MEPVRVQEAAFDPGQELNAFTATVPGRGGREFLGDHARRGGRIAQRTMEIEHYPA
jgi:hypothetical protein